MIEKIFYGRNGIDSFSITMIAFAWIFMLFNSYLTLFISIIIIGYALFRCFSKNVLKRHTEQYKFQSIVRAVAQFFVRNTIGIRKFFGFQALKAKNRKTTVYFKCPQCKKILSLPRHKGKLAVTCTVCRHEFVKKT